MALISDNVGWAATYVVAFKDILIWRAAGQALVEQK